MPELVLIKHAQPILDAGRPACEWRLGDEGEQQARELAANMEAFRPFSLLSSTEPKASRTAEIVAAEWGIDHREAPGLHEIDRLPLQILSLEEHERINRPIFDEPSRAMLGNESADDAQSRFSAAVQRELAGFESDTNLVVVTHGTVMALFVAAHNPVDAWDLWKKLACTDYVVLELPRFGLLEVGAADGELVTVATVNGPIEEGQLRSFLQAHGIPVKIRGEAIRLTHGITVDGIGAAAIEVPAEQAEAARELIARAERGELRLPDSFSEDADEGNDAG